MCVLLFVMSYVVKFGRTPLIAATMNGHLNVVKFFVEEAKANLETTTEV